MTYDPSFLISRLMDLSSSFCCSSCSWICSKCEINSWWDFSAPLLSNDCRMLLATKEITEIAIPIPASIAIRLFLFLSSIGNEWRKSLSSFIFVSSLNAHDNGNTQKRQNNSKALTPTEIRTRLSISVLLYDRTTSSLHLYCDQLNRSTFKLSPLVPFQNLSKYFSPVKTESDYTWAHSSRSAGIINPDNLALTDHIELQVFQFI